MVEQRTLTPHILVRVQVSQPIKKPPFIGGFCLGCGCRTRTNFGERPSIKALNFATSEPATHESPWFRGIPAKGEKLIVS